MAPPAPRVPEPTSAVATSLWACPKCKTDNPQQTAHCLACGTQLVRECPQCATMTSLVATGFCGTCGYQYDSAIRLRELRDAIDSKQAALSQLRGSLVTAQQ